MQELMSRHKAYSLSPRDCLKTTLFQKWQRMVAPPGKRGTILLLKHSLARDVFPFPFKFLPFICTFFEKTFLFVNIETSKNSEIAEKLSLRKRVSMLNYFHLFCFNFSFPTKKSNLTF